MNIKELSEALDAFDYYRAEASSALIHLSKVIMAVITAVEGEQRLLTWSERNLLSSALKAMEQENWLLARVPVVRPRIPAPHLAAAAAERPFVIEIVNPMIEDQLGRLCLRRWRISAFPASQLALRLEHQVVMHAVVMVFQDDKTQRHVVSLPPRP